MEQEQNNVDALVNIAKMIAEMIDKEQPVPEALVTAYSGMYKTDGHALTSEAKEQSDKINEKFGISKEEPILEQEQLAEPEVSEEPIKTYSEDIEERYQELKEGIIENRQDLQEVLADLKEMEKEPKPTKVMKRALKNAKHKRKEIKSDIRGERKKLSNFEKELKSAKRTDKRSISSIEREIKKSKRKIERLTKKLGKVEKRIKTLTANQKMGEAYAKYGADNLQEEFIQEATALKQAIMEKQRDIGQLRDKKVNTKDEIIQIDKELNKVENLKLIRKPTSIRRTLAETRDERVAQEQAQAPQIDKSKVIPKLTEAEKASLNEMDARGKQDFLKSAIEEVANGQRAQTTMKDLAMPAQGEQANTQMREALNGAQKSFAKGQQPIALAQ